MAVFIRRNNVSFHASLYLVFLKVYCTFRAGTLCYMITGVALQSPFCVTRAAQRLPQIQFALSRVPRISVHHINCYVLTRRVYNLKKVLLIAYRSFMG
jgi:hypothetical protein